MRPVGAAETGDEVGTAGAGLCTCPVGERSAPVFGAGVGAATGVAQPETTHAKRNKTTAN